MCPFAIIGGGGGGALLAAAVAVAVTGERVEGAAVQSSFCVFATEDLSASASAATSAGDDPPLRSPPKPSSVPCLSLTRLDEMSPAAALSPTFVLLGVVAEVLLLLATAADDDAGTTDGRAPPMARARERPSSRRRATTAAAAEEWPPTPRAAASKEEERVDDEGRSAGDGRWWCGGASSGIDDISLALLRPMPPPMVPSFPTPSAFVAHEGGSALSDRVRFGPDACVWPPPLCCPPPEVPAAPSRLLFLAPVTPPRATREVSDAAAVVRTRIAPARGGATAEGVADVGIVHKCTCVL